MSARIRWDLLGASILVIAGLLIAGANIYYFSSSAGQRQTPLMGRHTEPRPMPDLVFEDGQGARRTLAAFGNRVVLLNVWATWCVPCREEMPALDRLQQKLGGPNFEVVALSIDAGGAAAVKRFYGEIGIRSLGIYVDPASRAMAALGVVGIPTTLLIDRHGSEVGRRTGPAEWDGPEAVRMIEGYLDEAKP